MTSMFNNARRLLLVTVAALGLAAQAQTYPDKPVALVVPFAAGGPTDVVARLIAVPMGRALGQSVVVENTVGAGGTLAAQRIARSKPDGYTVLIHHMGMATAPALYRKLSFDPLKDFDYVGQVLDVPMTLLARKDFPARNLPELVSYLRANKEKVSLANAVAMARCAKNLVLLGDQMQLEQPIQGSHPGDAGLSALQYALKDTKASRPDAPVLHAVVPPDYGLFLGENIPQFVLS